MPRLDERPVILGVEKKRAAKQPDDDKFSLE